MTNTEAVLVLEQQISPLVAEAGAIRITDETTMNAAGEFLRLRVKAILRQADEAFDPIIAAAHATHRTAIEQKKAITAPLLAAEVALKRAIGDYSIRVRQAAEIERRQAEAAARVAAETARIEEAMALEKAGHAQAAVARIEAPIEVAPVRLPPAPAVPKGVSTRMVWKFRVVDATKISAPFLCPNEQAIAVVVKSMGRKALSLVGPGIEVYEEPVVSSRAQ